MPGWKEKYVTVFAILFLCISTCLYYCGLQTLLKIQVIHDAIEEYFCLYGSIKNL